MSSIYIPTKSFEAEKESILKTAKADALRQSSMTKTAGAMFRNQQPYDSPYLTLSDMKIPKTMREIFEYCRYFYKFDSLIGGAINALSRFPVTDIIIEDVENLPKGWDPKKDSPVLDIYKQMFDDLHIQELLIEIGIDYWLYGNCFIFGEYDNITGDPENPDIRWTKIYRLDPTKVTIDLDPLTQEKTYKMDVPRATRKIIKEKKPVDKYNAIPDVIKQAVKENKLVELNQNNIFHFAREGESGDGSVWGTPIVLNVIKQIAYRNILRQAQEAIAQEHIVPFRVYYLEDTQAMDIGGNWDEVVTSFASQLEKAAKDPNYKVVSPVPVNVLNLGGQGRALMLTQEIDQLQAEILAGMGVPREFIFGGVSYSAASISLRVLENQFITYRNRITDFLNEFMIRRLAYIRGEWAGPQDNGNIVTVKLADLKMQDDIQQKQMMISLNASNKISDEYLYGMVGVDADKMKMKVEIEIFERMERERRMQQYQLETQFIAQQYQMQQQAALTQMQIQLGLLQPMPQEDPKAQQEQTQESKPTKKDSNTQAKEASVAQTEMFKVASPHMPDSPLYTDQVDTLVNALAKYPQDELHDILKNASPHVQKILLEKLASGNPNAQGASGARNVALCNMTELEREKSLHGDNQNNGILQSISNQTSDYVTDNMSKPNPTILPPRRDTLI